MPDTLSDRQRAERIATLVQAIAGIADPGVRTQAEELVSEVLALYGDGIARMLELTARASGAGEALIDTFAADDLVGSLLLLHGLHPVDLTTRVTRALDGVRPSLAKQGGQVELLDVADGVAHLRLRASGHGCGSSAAMLKQKIEEAIYAAAPDLDGLEVEGDAPPPQLITLTPARRRASPPSLPVARRREEGSAIGSSVAGAPARAGQARSTRAPITSAQ